MYVQAVERQVSRCDKMSSSSPLKPTAASTAAAAAGSGGSGGSGTSSVHHHQAVQLSNTSLAATPARTESTTARYCDML